MMLPASMKKNDQAAYWIIGVVSVAVFSLVVLTSRVTVHVDLGFNPHIFASINAVLNSIVTLLLIIGLVLVKQKKYLAHKQTMLMAITLSVCFLLSYVAHHLFAGETKFGGQGAIKYFYYAVLIPHIVLAGIIMPFVLFTAYKGLTGEYATHKKLVRYTYPLWLYVAITGVLVYLLISPYYK